MKYVLLLALFFLLPSCADDADDNAPCTGPAQAGLRILVRDAITHDPITEDVTVVATEGDFEEELTPDGTYFIGVYDRQANYIVTVTKIGYETYVSDPISVFVPGCHAVETLATIDLQPE